MGPKKRSLGEIQERMQLRSPSVRQAPQTLSPTPPKTKRPQPQPALKELKQQKPPSEQVVFKRPQPQPPLLVMCSAKMKEKVNERLVEHDAVSGVSDTFLNTKDQLDIIREVVPQKRGTQVSGVGGSLRRPLEPRGGSRSRQSNVELLALVHTLAARVKALEEQQPRGNSAAASNASDGASLV